MHIVKTLKTDCIIQKVEGVSRATGKKYTSYRVVFPDLNTMPVFLPYNDKASSRLAVIVDILGDEESSNV